MANERLLDPAMPVQDIWADGIARLEIVGEQLRVVFFRWAYVDGGWLRQGLDFNMVMPVGCGLLAASKQLPLVQMNNEDAVARH